jgi:chromosome partitioning protein
MILALINNKGGVGKTTTAMNLAAGLARRDRRVLLVDLDSQGSASLSLGVARTALSPSSAEVLLDELPIAQAIRPTPVTGLDLLTGTMALANADLRLAERAGRERRLQAALDPVRQAYAFILIDCPPSLSLLPVNALIAADAFLVPVTPHYLALEGLVNLMEAVERVRQGVHTAAPLLGLVLTLVDYRLRVTREIVDLIRGQYGDQVFRTEIRVNVRLAEAPSFGQPIFVYDPASTGAEAYRRLTMEVLQRCRKAGRIA